MFTRYKLRDRFVPIVCILAPILTYFINSNSETLFGGFTFGFLIVVINGLLTFLGLRMLSIFDKPQKLVTS